MRVIAASLIVLTCLTARAQSQVSVDLRALDAPGGTRPATPRPAAPAPRADPQPAPERRAARPTPQPPAVQNAPASTGPARISGQATAPALVLVPIPALPTAQPAPAPPVATAPPPPPPAQPFPPPIRVMFADGKTDLSPGDEARIRSLAREIPAVAASSVNVVAYAAGKPEDPSTARRLSLSRGLAVRSVLLDCGIPSSQIYVRAMGSKAENGPPDRVELTVARLGEIAR